jgi:hypothetical protein
MTARTAVLESKAPCCVIAFPLMHRVGRIREVARKLNGKSRAAASFYERQVTDGLLAHLERLGVDETEQERQVDSFWTQVNVEVRHQISGSDSPGGDLAC